MTMRYIERQPRLSTEEKLRQLQQRYIECQQELGYYKNLAARYKEELGKIELRERGEDKPKRTKVNRFKPLTGEGIAHG